METHESLDASFAVMQSREKILHEKWTEYLCPVRVCTDKNNYCKRVLQFPLAIRNVYRNELAGFRESVYNDKCGRVALKGDQW